MEKAPLISLASIKGDFIIPAYQRAYRWGKKQAESLLNDLHDFYQDGAGDFFLQPIVVTRPDPSRARYELIDGQQRLTALYLLDAALCRLLGRKRRALQYEILYESHADRARFLRKLAEDCGAGAEEADSCLDFYCLFQARQSILDWLEPKKDPDFLAAFHAKLLNNVKFLLHDTSQEEDSTPARKFIRINTGRIPLADGELCRALFLTPKNHDFSEELPEASLPEDENKWRGELLSRIQYKRCVMIGQEWDRIERSLRDSAFWNFIGGGGYGEPARIGRLLELHNGVRSDFASENACFDKYWNEFKNQAERKDAGREWAALLKTMERLQYWFQDNDYYHWIGCLTVLGGSGKLSYLLGQAARLDEDRFKELLMEEIRKSVFSGGVPPLDELTFLNNYSLCKNILFLFNIEYSRLHQNHSPRFPFLSFNLDACTIEHVFARNVERLKEAEDRAQWVEEHMAFIKEMERHNFRGEEESAENTLPEEKFASQKEALLDRAGKFLSRLRNKKEGREDSLSEEFNALSDAMGAFTERLDEDSTHDLYNLALLDHDLNSHFNNSIFAIKQKKLRLRLAEGGEFIPAATIALFMRHFARRRRAEAWWTREDQDDYRAAMRAVLSHFWPELDSADPMPEDGDGAP